MNEENTNRESVGGWICPILAAGFVIVWTLLIYSLIGTRPAHWDYGTVPYVPGESVFSVERPPAGPAPPQVELPGGR